MPRRASGAASSGNILTGLCGCSSSCPRNRILIGRPVCATRVGPPLPRPAPLPWVGVALVAPAPRAPPCSVWARTDNPAADNTATPTNITHARRALAVEIFVGIRKKPYQFNPRLRGVGYYEDSDNTAREPKLVYSFQGSTVLRVLRVLGSGFKF